VFAADKVGQKSFTVFSKNSETLWQLSKRGVEVPTVFQIMIALFYENPHAFRANNLNALKPGQKLSVPSRSGIVKYRRQHAYEIAVSHNNEWEKLRKGLVKKQPSQPRLPQQKYASQKRGKALKEIAPIQPQVNIQPPVSSSGFVQTEPSAPVDSLEGASQFNTEGLAIVSERLAQTLGFSKAQLMVALYFDNQDAFFAGNMFALRNDKVLSVKDVQDLDIVDAGAAEQTVRYHQQTFSKIVRSARNNQLDLDAQNITRRDYLDRIRELVLRGSSVKKNHIVTRPPEISQKSSINPDNSKPLVQTIKVIPGETLWKVASRLHKGEVPTKFQIMLGLFRANLEMFTHDNLNAMKRNTRILKVPTAEQLLAIDRQGSYELSVAHNHQWKTLRNTSAVVRVAQKVESVQGEVVDVVAASKPEGVVDRPVVSVYVAPDIPQSRGSSVQEGSVSADNGQFKRVISHGSALSADIVAVSKSLRTKFPNAALEQIMVALYESNKFDFWGGNMFRSKHESALKMPSADSIQLRSKEEAREVIIEHKKTRNEIDVILDQLSSGDDHTYAQLKRWQLHYANVLDKTSGVVDQAQFSPENLAVSGYWQKIVVSEQDTLWTIAASLHESSEPNIFQIMVGVYQANPHAFWGKNIHGMRVGQTLDVPPLELLSRVDREQALRLIETHESAWQKIKVIAKDVVFTDAEKNSRIAQIKGYQLKFYDLGVDLKAAKLQQQRIPSEDKKKT